MNLKQLACSWRKRHKMMEISTHRWVCTLCGKGWFYDPIYFRWRVDTDRPGSPM